MYKTGVYIGKTLYIFLIYFPTPVGERGMVRINYPYSFCKKKSKNSKIKSFRFQSPNCMYI